MKALIDAEEDKFSGASRTTPDIEDINNDNTLNENESYYQYKAHCVRVQWKLAQLYCR